MDQKKNLENKSVVFNAIFYERHRVTICADTCSEDKIKGKHTVDGLKKAGVEYTIKKSLQSTNFSHGREFSWWKTSNNHA